MVDCRSTSIGSYWDNRNVANRYDKILTPAFHLVGWFDRFSVSTVDNCLGMLKQSTSEVARRGRNLVIGPWPPSVPVATISGDHSWGPNASVDDPGDPTPSVPGVMSRPTGRSISGQSSGLDLARPCRTGREPIRAAGTAG